MIAMLFVAAARAAPAGFALRGAPATLRRRAQSRLRAAAAPRGQAKAVGRAGSAAPYTVEAGAAASGLPALGRPYTVLGVETSCDDTAAAVMASDGRVLGECRAGQASVHEKWGGIVPGLARDAHVTAIDAVVAAALADAGMASAAEVDAVAVTTGPGLEICLRVGVAKATDLALAHGKPFVAVHHLEAHCLLTRAPLEGATVAPAAEAAAPPPAPSGFAPLVGFPYLAVLVSGGHCQLLLVEGVGQFSVLGGTRDDSLGEAYDKVARMLALPTGGGGGPAVEALALEGTDALYAELPVPMRSKAGTDLSYSGLKNAFRMAVERRREALGLDADAALPRQDAADLAAAFQHSAISHLEDRLKRAMAWCEANRPGVTEVAVVGGVAANAELRRRVSACCDARKRGDGDGAGRWNLVVPPPRLCTDNGVMVCWAAIEKLELRSSDAVDPNKGESHVRARWPLGTSLDEKHPELREMRQQR